MSGNTTAVSRVAPRWSGLVLTVVFLVAAVFLFALIYLSFPGQQHFGALITIGILSLLFALGSYLAESLSRDPVAQRSLAWGFFGMGFAVLFLTVGLAPSYSIVSPASALWDIFFLFVLLAVTIGLIVWRVRGVRETERREVQRAEWRSESPPSALSYAAANSPSVPSTAPPSTAPSPPPPRSP